MKNKPKNEYGSRKTHKQSRKLEEKLEKKRRRKARKWYVKLPIFLLKSFITLLVIGIVAGLGGGAWFWSEHGESISENVAEGYRIAETIDRAHFDTVEPTQLVDGEGKIIREFKERSYEYLDLQEDDDLYQKVSDVVTSIEDERFYRHKGFDYYGVGVAVINYIRGGELRGASTITQQVVKNTYLTQAQTLERKIQEAVIAQELEKVFTKREILEFYVNGNYYANGRYGLASASNYYYSKPVEELTSGEMAVLIGIPNNPTVYDPTREPENVLHKRNVILAKMLELGKISQEEYETEKDKDLNLKITPAPIDNSITDFAESYAIDNAVELMMERSGFEFKYWFDTVEEKEAYNAAHSEMYVQMREAILKGGYIIETSINHEKQAQLQKAIDDRMSIYTRKDSETGLYEKQASAVTIDNRTNEVVAIVGGRSQEGNTFNRAHLGERQPASSIKPFVSYAPAFDRGLLPQSIMADRPINNGPKNWYSGYRGDMTLRYAIEQSVNTVAYRLLVDNGVDVGLEKLAQMEFGDLDPNDQNPIISLGGFTYGTTPLDMAKGLNTFVNQGQYTDPSSVRRIVQRNTEEVLYDRKEDVRYKEVYSPEASYMTLDIMKGVLKIGSGKLADFGYPHIAGKTGTSNDRKDQWFIGTTPYYATAVWVGNDKPSEQEFEVSLRPMEIFGQAMKGMHQGLPVVDFNKPNTLTRHSDGSFTVRKAAKQEKDPKQLQREQDEQSRINNETSALQKRLDDLDYRLVHGLTLKEEEERERYAELRIQMVSQEDVRSEDDFNQIELLYNEALNALERVKRQSVKTKLTNQLETVYAGKEEARRELIREAKRAEEARKEQERLRIEWEKAQEEEAKRLEEEARQAELEAIKAQEEALKELEEVPEVPEELDDSLTDEETEVDEPQEVEESIDSEE